MRLDGLHHVAAVTGDGRRCARFYADVLGLDIHAGCELSFLEIPGIQPGRPGAGMIHSIAWRVAGAKALDFWELRLADSGVACKRVTVATPLPGPALRFADPDGLQHELVADGALEPAPPSNSSPIPTPFALGGLAGVRSYCLARTASADLLAGRLVFSTVIDGIYRVVGDTRASWYAQEEPPPRRPRPGAGSVHHVAWRCAAEDLAAWRQRVIGLGARVSSPVDQGPFRSIYFREPSGVLFEIATTPSARGLADGGDSGVDELDLFGLEPYPFMPRNRTWVGLSRRGQAQRARPRLAAAR